MMLFKVRCFDFRKRLVVKRLLVCVLALSLVHAFGCNSGKVPAKVPTEKPSTAEARSAKESTETVTAGAASKTPDATGTGQVIKSDSPSSLDPAEASAEPAPATTAVEIKPPEPIETWTQLQFVSLNRGGPLVWRLEVNVDGRDLAAGLEQAIQDISEELDIEFSEDSPSWDDLLKMPLVRSGVLGNLVPDESQKAQLLNLYDKVSDGLVSPGEFEAFITRGLVRVPQLRLAKARSNQSMQGRRSPLGPLDRDADGTLDDGELSQIADSVAALDIDSDSIITRTESEREATSDEAGMAPPTSMIGAPAIHQLDAEPKSSVLRPIMDHYSFGGVIRREDFSAWSDERWRQLDIDGDEQLSAREFAGLGKLNPDVQLLCRYGGVRTEDDAKPNCRIEATELRGGHLEKHERAHGAGCRTGNFLLNVTTEDNHSGAVKKIFTESFQASLDDANARAALAGRLQVKETELSIFDSEPHGPTSEEMVTTSKVESKSERAWRWLVTLRDYHLSAEWQAIDSVWFAILDSDGDGNLIPVEVGQAKERLRSFDGDGDGVLTSEELPTVISARVTRKDERFPRLDAAEPGVRGKESLGPKWFLAMDINGDQAVSASEFLGEHASFEDLDKDKDGIIELGEVYEPPQNGLK